MPVGDTLVNLVVNGAIALGLARLLQQQYEARIKAVTDGYEARILDLKERIVAQSGKIDTLLESNNQLADAALVSANALRDRAQEKEKG